LSVRAGEETLNINYHVNALIAAIKDESVELSDLRSFADTVRVKETDWVITTATISSTLIIKARNQGVKMLKEWKEARERMFHDLDAHVKAVGDILAKFQNESGTPPTTESTNPGATMEVKTKSAAKKEEERAAIRPDGAAKVRRGRYDRNLD
jgi:hypothetical protein